MRWRSTGTSTDTGADGESRAAADAPHAAEPAAATLTLMERGFARAVHMTRLDTRPSATRENAPNAAGRLDGIRRTAPASPVGPSPDAGGNGHLTVAAPAAHPSAPGVVDRMRHWMSERSHVIVIAGLVVVTSLATALVISEGARQITTPGRDTTPYLVTGPRGPVRLPTVESPPGHGLRGGTGAQPDRDRTVRRQPGDPGRAADRDSRRNADVNPIRRHPIADRPLPPGRSPESGRTPPRDNSRDTRCRGRVPDIAGCPSRAPRRPSHALLDPVDDATGDLIHTGRDAGGDTGPAGTRVSEVAPLDVTEVPVTSLGLLPVAG